MNWGNSKAYRGVLRGGSFNNNGSDKTVANRNGNNGSGGSNTNVGFRVVL